jgi:hypothetical protein
MFTSRFGRNAASLSAVALGLLLCPGAEAARTISLPPLRMASTHGGVTQMNTCISADMLGYAAYGRDGTTFDGVQSVDHTYTIYLKNLSSVDQNVTVTLLPGTFAKGVYSDPPDSGVPNKENTAHGLSGSPSIDILLPPNGDSKRDFKFTSNDGGSAISPFESSVECTGIKRTCIMQESVIVLQIKVAEDRGAVQANLTATAHRCFGNTDHYVQPPISFQVNGGRPF